MEVKSNAISAPCSPVEGEANGKREIVFVYGTDDGGRGKATLLDAKLREAQLNSEKVRSLPVKRVDTTRDTFDLNANQIVGLPVLLFRDVDHDVECGRVTGALASKYIKAAAEGVLRGEHPNVRLVEWSVIGFNND